MNNKEKQIANLIQRIDSLTLEANGLTRELRDLTDGANEENTTELKKGDLVVITNNYLGQKGTTGVIINVSNKQVTIQNKTTGKKYTRKKMNVQRQAR
jgi:hypothetical protein